ncbi:unnamed protein product [Phytophthora fragariaefolia]|uniref:Unnamed protein product n=1 Tax=Phytophthora fragariaefolia TaxID=1490495 RepID=A0A9W6XZS4_9STRA|nr:unnamed protein product [Phytophthora fragariaefolia]
MHCMLASKPNTNEGDGEKPQDPDTSPMGGQGSAVCNRVASVQGTVTTQGADAAAARAGRGGSVRAPPMQSVAAGSAHVEECAGVVARANKSGRVRTPTTQGVVAGSARATEDAGACARATTGGRSGAPTSKTIRGDKVTSTPKAEAPSREADSAAADRVPQVLDVFTGEPKVGGLLPTVAELLELEELSYVELLYSLKAGELAEVVLLRPEGGALEHNPSSVMDCDAALPADAALQIPFLGCFLGKDGVRADPEKVCAIAQWPVPISQKYLRKWLGLANYMPKYSANYAEMARPLTNLLKKDIVWSWTAEAQQAFEAIKSSLQSAPISALSDEDQPFSVVSDASDFAIGCALLQVDAGGRGRVVAFQSRQLKEAEKNYPVHDKELLVIKYALVKFRVHRLGQKPFVIFTDHASLRTATSSPHLSQRMARWLSFFAEYNFTVEYKPGKQNVFADTLSRRPDYELAHLAYLESPLDELIREAYADDDELTGLVEAQSAPNRSVELTARQRSRLHRYSVMEGLFYYQVDGSYEPRIVVPNDENLRHRVFYEAHDTPLSGHLGREKTYTSAFVSDRDPRFVSHFWQHLFRLLGTRWDMSTADHPQTDGQTEQVNRVLEDTLRSVCAAEPTK